MDNNSGNSPENQPPADQEQPKPIYETIPTEDMQPEEVSSDVSSTDDALSAPPSEIPSEQAMYPSSGGGGNRTKFLIIGGVIVFFILIFFGILKLFFSETKTPAAAKPVKLTYWGLWEDKLIYDEVIKEYQTKNPNVTITYEKMSHEDYLLKLLTRSKNNVGPDIFRFHNTWLPQIRELVAPLPANVMTNEEFEKTFYPVHARDLKVDKYYYGIPLSIDGLVLIYNDALFKQAGITKAPALWDDVLDYAERLTVRDTDGNIVTSGIALGTSANIEHFSDIFGFMLLQNSLGTNQEEIKKKSRDEIWGTLKKLNTPEASSIFQEYRRLAEPPNEVWNDTMSNSITAFIQQKVAMIFAPSWEAFVIKNNNFDIPVKVAPLPQLPQDPQFKPASIAFGSYWVEGVSRFSSGDEQLEAWKFLKYLSQKEILTKMYKKQKDTRLFGEPYPRVDMADLLINDPYAGPVIKQAQYYYSLPLASRTFDGGINHTGGMNDDIISYLADAVNKTIKGVSYTEALRTAQQGIEQIYTKYKIPEK